MNNKKIGEFLASLRKVKGLTQQQLADEFFISNKTVSKWECGDSIPDVEMLKPLADFYGVTVDEILSGERNGTGKINSQQTQSRQKDSQTKYIYKSIVGKFDLWSLLAFVLFSVAIIMFFITFALASSLPSQLMIVLSVAISCIALIVSLIFFVVAVQTAKSKMDSIDDQQLVLKLKTKINKRSAVYWSFLVTLLFAYLLLIVAVTQTTFETLVFFPTVLLFFVLSFVIFAKLFEVDLLAGVKSQRLLKCLNFVARYKILTFCIVALSAVTILWTVTERVTQTVVVNDIVTGHFNVSINLMYSLFNYSHDFDVIRNCIICIVFFGLAVASTVFAVIKNKSYSTITSACLLVAVFTMIEANKFARIAFIKDNQLSSDYTPNNATGILTLFVVYFATTLIYLLVSKVADRKKASE